MTDATFQQDFLGNHNAYRAKHGVPPLSLSKDLSADAQVWADHLLAKNNLEHSGTNDGENIFFMSSSSNKKPTGGKVVDLWYSEIKDYNWSKPGFSEDTGHFTQVVWKGSTKLGVGMATGGGKTFVVGRYRPAGNIPNEGYFEKNVPQPGS